MPKHPLICIFLFQAWILSSQEYNVREFGAVPDGLTINTRFIQNAIDEAHAKGGGKVVIPKGRFLTGTVVLKSNVELHLQRGAVLVGSTNPDNYLKINRWKALVMADQQENLAITGDGEIDGQGRRLALNIDSLFYAGKIDSINYNFVEMRPKEPMRPQLVEMVDCKNIIIRDITMRNAACWVQTYERCHKLVMEDVRIYSDAYWNNDGIDISDCTNVRITGCDVNTADDGICLKSHDVNLACDSIYIADCRVRSSASAVKFGTASYGGFRNVTIRDIRVYDTFRSAIAIESVDGGHIENILVDGIRAKNTGNAIFIRLGKRNKNRPPGTVKDITIRNVKADIYFERPDYEYDIRGPSLPFFHNIFPSSIVGIPGHRVQNVTLENITIRYPGRGNNGLANRPLSALDRVPEREANYPEYSMFGELPAWGMYVRHMDSLTMRDITLSIRDPDYRPAIVFDDVFNSTLTSLCVIPNARPEQIVLYKTDEVLLQSDIRAMQIKQTDK